MNSISLRQLAPKLEISVEEIKQVCELLENPVQQQGDRTVVLGFTMPDETVIEAEQFFRMLLEKAPTKDDKPDVLASAVEFKTQIDNYRSQAASNSKTTSSYSSQTGRITFNEIVGSRLKISSEEVDELDPNSITGLGVQAMEAIAPQVAAQLDYTTKEVVLKAYFDRIHNGIPTQDPKLMTEEERALGKSEQGCSITNVLDLITQESANFRNLVDFNNPMQSTFASRQLEGRQMSQALPQFK